MIPDLVITGLATATALYSLTIIAVWSWRARLRSRRVRKGLAPTASIPLVLPKTPELSLTRIEVLTRYVRYPAQFQRASSVKLLVDGREAYPDMLAALDSAAATVDLETYVLRADRVGTRFQEALRRAAQRGVHVRLLYDYIGSLGLPNRFVQDLTDAGVEVAVYHPPVINRAIWAMNRRDHRKMLVVDRRVVFLGGLNIADDYAAFEEGGGGWRDTHIRLDGNEVAEAGERIFDVGWRKATACRETITLAERVKRGIRRRLRKIVTIRDAWRPGGDALGVMLDADGTAVQIVGNEEFRYRWRIRRAYLHAINRAQRYILIENAYFIPDRAVRRALTRAVKRGVLVAVAVSRYSDFPIAAYACRSLYGELLERGVRLFEWPHSMLHAKTAVIDDAWAIVGSYNFDHRSLFHQLEVVAVVADQDFAVRLREQTLADLARCHEVTLWEHGSRSWRQMLLESGAYVFRRWL